MFEIISNISSIGSLIITLFVLYNLRSIRKVFLFNARVPELNNKLSELASLLSKQLNYSNGLTTEIKKNLADTEVVLNYLKKKVNRHLSKKIKILINDIKFVQGDKIVWNLKKKKQLSETQKQEFLEKIYIDIYKITSDVNELYKDYQWER